MDDKIPFDGPYRKSSEPRKDKYGNVIKKKNLAKHLAKKAMQSQMKKEEKMKGKDPCWKDYEMVGMKKKNGKEVPNCVPKEEVELDEAGAYSRYTASAIKKRREEREKRNAGTTQAQRMKNKMYGGMMGGLKKEEVELDEKLEQDGPNRGKLNFKIAKTKAGQKYQSSKVSQRVDMNKKNDPGAEKKGYALSVIDKAKAMAKAKKKGLKPSGFATVVGKKGFKEEMKLDEVTTDIINKVGRKRRDHAYDAEDKLLAARDKHNVPDHQLATHPKTAALHKKHQELKKKSDRHDAMADKNADTKHWYKHINTNSKTSAERKAKVKQYEEVHLDEGKSKAGTALKMAVKDFDSSDKRHVQVLSGKLENWASTGNPSMMADIVKYLVYMDTEPREHALMIIKKADPAMYKSIMVKLSKKMNEAYKVPSNYAALMMKKRKKANDEAQKALKDKDHNPPWASSSDKRVREGLSPAQDKHLDVHDDDKIDAKDFKKLRDMRKKKTDK